jgi:predicted DNA binding CopG/RHH family protein
MKKNKGRTKARKEITDYDHTETSLFIDKSKPLKFEDLGLTLPSTPPTQVVSIRLPSELLNEIKAIGSQRDIPYQALIKLFLAESVAEMKKRSA